MNDADRIASLETQLASESDKTARVARAIADIVAEGPYIDGDVDDPKAYVYWLGQKETLAAIVEALEAGDARAYRAAVADSERRYRTPAARDSLAADTYHLRMAEFAFREIRDAETVLLALSNWEAVVRESEAIVAGEPGLTPYDGMRRAIFASGPSRT